jgi:hypothetical protein
MRSPMASSREMHKGSRGAGKPRTRRGFSLIETLLTTVLATLLGMLLGMACATFCRPALEVDARARITREGILAAQSLACDMGGFVAESVGRTGTVTQYSFTSWDLSQGNALVLNYQGANTTDLIAITYQLSGKSLVRYNSSTGVTTTVATYVTAFSVAPYPDNETQAQIVITVSFRNYSATYTLIGISPI